MPRPDPYLGTRQSNEISWYQEIKKQFNEKTEHKLYKVWDNNFKKYKYILATKKDNILSYFYFYVSRKLYFTRKKGLYSRLKAETVDTNLLKAYDVSKTMQGRFILMMFKFRFWW
jgi:hypothetical protein